MNPRAEAVALLDGRYDARVLEPSPPAVTEPPWLADDPVGRGEPPGDRPRVGPVGKLSWEDVVRERPELAGWCAERWLAAYRRLGPPPAGLQTTRIALHRVAEQRVGPLEVDPAAAAFLGEWYGFAASVLEELRAGVDDDRDPSRVQLWPEHFDIAVDLGVEADGARAGYGGSPGDELHPFPYLYVTPWANVPNGPLWQQKPFPGAELPYASVLAAPDQREAALDFFRDRMAALTANR